MSTYSLKNVYVIRALICLSYRWWSLSEVTRRYNTSYPPSRIQSVIGIEMSEERIAPILHFLVKEGMAEREVLGFTDKPLPIPLPHYRITATGQRFLSAKKK